MRVIAMLMVLAAGCTLDKHGTGGDDGGICNEPTGGGAGEPAQEVRDPSTGQCVAEGIPCDPQCGPCPAVVQLEGPSCFGPCENLDEATCLTTASCHATYSDGSGAATARTPPCSRWPAGTSSRSFRCTEPRLHHARRARLRGAGRLHLAVLRERHGRSADVRGVRLRGHARLHRRRVRSGLALRHPLRRQHVRACVYPGGPEHARHL